MRPSRRRVAPRPVAGSRRPSAPSRTRSTKGRRSELRRSLEPTPYEVPRFRTEAQRTPSELLRPAARAGGGPPREPGQVDARKHGTLEFAAVPVSLGRSPRHQKQRGLAATGYLSWPGCRSTRQRAKIYLEALNGDDQPTRS